MPNNLNGAIFLLCIISAIVGWGVIECVLWLFSFVHVSFGC